MASKKSYKANKDKKTRGERLKLTPDRDDNLQYINWFPGHMNKAMKEIKSKLKMVDLVIEVRDARVPMHSGNPALKEVLGTKAKLIFFNKENYCDPMAIKTWKKFLDERNIPYFFGNILEENCPELLLEKATEADTYRKSGKPMGLLHGIPVALKDIIGTYDMPTECGTVLVYQGFSCGA